MKYSNRRGFIIYYIYTISFYIIIIYSEGKVIIVVKCSLGLNRKCIWDENMSFYIKITCSLRICAAKPKYVQEHVMFFFVDFVALLPETIALRRGVFSCLQTCSRHFLLRQHIENCTEYFPVQHTYAIYTLF